MTKLLDSLFREDPFDADIIAKRIRDHYTSYIRTVFKNYIPGSEWDPVWEQAARICLKHRFDPYQYVVTLISNRRNPSPSMLIGDKAVRKMSHHRDVAAPIRRRWEVESDIIRLYSCIAEGRSLNAALTDSNESFSDTFRYCVALGAGIPSVASKYRESARLEVWLNPEMEDIYSHLMDTTFGEVLDDIGGALDSSGPPGS
jgi:hypothetical protein